VRELIATPEGIGPRVHETENAVAPIRRDDDEYREGAEQQHDQHRKQARAHAAEEKDADGDRDDDHEGTEVRFLEQQDADEDHGTGHRQEGFLQVVHHRHLAHRIVGGIKHGEEFHQLRGLQVGNAQRQPTARAIDFAAEAGNQHHDQQHHPGHEQPRRKLLPGRQRHLESDCGGDDADAQEDGVTHQEIGRLVAGEFASLGDGNGG
jgi:hypothetical protein